MASKTWEYHPYGSQTAGSKHLMTFPITRTGGHWFPPANLELLFSRNGYTITNIISAGQATTRISPGEWVGSLNNIRPGFGYWVQVEEQVPFPVGLSFSLEDPIDGLEYYNLGYQGNPTLFGNGLKLIGYSNTQDGAFKTTYAWGADGNGAGTSTTPGGAGNGNNDTTQIIGASVAATVTGVGGSAEWVGSLVTQGFKEGNAYWTKNPTGNTTPGSGRPFMFINTGDDCSNGGVSGETLNYAASDPVCGIPQLGESGFLSPPETQNKAVIIVNAHSGYGGEFDGTNNQILDLDLSDMTNNNDGKILGLFKHHANGLNTTPSTALVAAAVTPTGGSWQGSQDHNNITDFTVAHADGSANNGTTGLTMSFTTSGDGNTVTCDAIAAGAYGLAEGDTITLTDPGSSSNTAVFTVKAGGLTYNAAEPFYLSGPAKQSNDPGQTWTYQSNTMRSYWLEMNIQDALLTESENGGILTGTDDASGFQLRIWHPVCNKYYWLKLRDPSGNFLTTAQHNYNYVLTNCCTLYASSSEYTQYVLNKGWDLVCSDLPVHTDYAD